MTSSLERKPERRRHAVSVSPRGGIGAALAVVLIGVCVAFQGSPTFSQPRITGPTLPVSSEAEPTGDIGAPPSSAGEGSPAVTWILTAVAAIALLLLAAVVIRAILRRLPRRGRREAPLPVAVGATTAPEEAAPIIVREAVDAAIASVDEARVAGDAIVAAWLALESTAERAGLVRARSETPAEFAVRIIGRRGDTADDTGLVLAAYERVRFGHARAEDADRTAVRAALVRIREGWR